MSDRGPPPWLYLLLAVGAVAGAWMIAWDGSPSRRTQTEAPEKTAKETPTQKQTGWAPRSTPAVEQPPTPGCTPHDTTICIRGDAWWLDSCGNAHEKADECGATLCEEGACTDPDPRCDELAQTGDCEGERAIGCAAGRYYDRDCSADDRVCVLTEEGAACREATGPRCIPGVAPRCEGDVLVSCLDGQLQELPCASVGGVCGPTRGGSGRACIRPGRALAGEDCGACGCPPEPGARELCNGVDDDGDGFVDEGVECGPVDLLALVVADARGHTDYTDADLDAELQQINRYFAREDDLGLTFRWADIVYVDAERWLEMDDEGLQEVLTQGGHLRKLDDFYVPIVFTRSLLIDGVPRPGIATPPNGTCGGVRRVQGRQPLVGGVVIAKQRWESTVAHEIGHYLGLCHTHAPTVDAIVEQDENGVACEEPCAFEDDGICDTPLDPGPSSCAITDVCGPHCEDGARPDVANVMAYYPQCRSAFTADQARQVRAGLALRRGWYACVFESCACKPAANDCPDAMTCSPYDQAQGDGTAWRCRLDGPAPPGAPCERADACDGALCVQQSEGGSACARMCSEQTVGCTCIDVPGIEVPLCREDLDGSAR